LWHDENVVELDIGNGYTICDYTKNHWIVQNGWVLWYVNCISILKRNPRVIKYTKSFFFYMQYKNEMEKVKENNPKRNRVSFCLWSLSLAYNY
jgi:hypothetical protein